MNNRTSILYSLFNIQSSEKNVVVNLFFHHFFQGFGLALVYIIANSLFLSHFSVKELPYVYIISGLMIVVVGRLYAHIEHQYKIEKVLSLAVIMVIAVLSLQWLGSQLLGMALFAFLFLASYQILYLLYNLEFWGLSALVFDVRQSKRVFGLISAGDMPSKMLGYLLVSIIAPYIDLAHLILLSILSVGVSYYFLSRVLRSHDLHGGKTRDLDHHYTNENDKKGPVLYLKSFFKNRFILIAAILSFIIVISFAAINFSFLAEVKYKFKTDKELAGFFGSFFAAGQFIIIITKTFLSGRVIKWLGVKRGLLVLPYSIILIMIVSFFIHGTDNNYTNLLYIYGFLMLFTDILNYSIHQPLFLSLFQPLNAHLRLHGHTVIKGFVNGLGLMAAGFSILLLLQTGPENRLLTFAIFIIILTIIWAIWVFILDQGYVKLLKDAINIRRLSGGELLIRDERVLEKVNHKIKSGKPWEVIYGLELLKKQNRQQFEQIQDNFLAHNNGEVRQWFLKHAGDNHFRKNLDHYRNELLGKEKKIEEQKALIRRIAKVDHMAADWADNILHGENHHLVGAAIEGLLQGKSIEGMVLAGNRLIELKESANFRDNIMVCRVIRNLRLNNFHTIIANYLHSGQDELYREALLTSRHLESSELFDIIVKRFAEHAGKSWYLDVLSSFPEQVLSHFRSNLSIYMDSRILLESIIFTCKQIPGRETAELLLQEVFLSDVELRDKSITVLSSYQDQKHFESWYPLIKKYINEELIFLKELQQFAIETRDIKIYSSLFSLETQHTKNRIFSWLSLIYTSKQIMRARDAYFSHYANKKANAIEMLEEILPQELRKKLIPVFEHKDHSVSTEVLEDPASFILNKGHMFFSDWSLAIALNSLHVAENSVNKELENWKLEKSLIIRQVYNKKKTQTTYSMKDKISLNELHEIEKVSILKGTSLFSETPENLLVDLAGVVKTVRLNEDDILFEQGDPGDCMFIVFSGSVRIMDEEKHLADFSELDFFGELSLLDNEPRSATAIANSDSLLLSISQEDFYELISFRTEVAKSVLKVLSQRLRKQNKS